MLTYDLLMFDALELLCFNFWFLLYCFYFLAFTLLLLLFGFYSIAFTPDIGSLIP